MLVAYGIGLTNLCEMNRMEYSRCIANRQTPLRTRRLTCQSPIVGRARWPKIVVEIRPAGVVRRVETGESRVEDQKEFTNRFVRRYSQAGRWPACVHLHCLPLEFARSGEGRGGEGG